MSISSPKRLATYLSLLISVITFITLIINIYFIKDDPLVYIVLSSLLLFVVIFIAVFYILNYFIMGKIDPIYKTINSLKISERELYDNFENKDIIEEVNSEVMDWAKQKTQEIKDLKASERFRKEFIGNVAHELKTPIFNIQGYILTLLDGGLDDTEINRRYLERTEKNVNRLISTIKDVDTISQLEAGMLRLNYENFNIIKVVEEVIELQEMRSQKYKISIVFEGEWTEPVFVYADKKRISEVINNLIVNSLKYGREGGTTRVIVSERYETVVVKVRDNGIGISEKDLARVFERFYRVDKSRSRERGGSGLGLSIVKHIIEAHRQKITVQSTLSEGTTFQFTLKKGKTKH